MVLLSARNIRKDFGERAILRDASLELGSTDHVALVGPNGVGKTTLLKILTGELAPDGGEVEMPSAGSVGYLEQHPEFGSTDTVWSVAVAAMGDMATLTAEAERVAKELGEAKEPDEHDSLLEHYDRLQVRLHQADAYNWEHRVEKVLQGLGFAKSWYDRPAGQLSGGQQNRLMLVCLLLQQPDLMILDEPNNHLDIESTEWLESMLAEWPAAYLLVSHDRFFLDQTANVVVELVDGQLDRFKGNYTAYVRQKAERLEVQRRTYEKKNEEIEKLKEFIRKHHHGQKSAQAEDRRKKLARIELVDPPREIPTPTFHFPQASRTGDVVVRAVGLTKSYDTRLFQDLDLQIERGERWAILGSNGTGKSTLIKCLLGHVEPDAGTVQLGHNLKIGYFDQLLQGLSPEVSAAEAIRVPHRDLDDKARRDILGAFGISGDVALKPIRKLSGGERNRTMLARLSAMEANVLVLDEPTNHLDLWSRHALEAAIRQFDGTVLLVTHDRYLVNAVADHVLVLHDGHVSQLVGNYDSYKHWLKRGLAVEDRSSLSDRTRSSRSSKTKKATSGEAPHSPMPADSQPQSGSPPKKRRRKYKYRKVADLENDIVEVEGQIESLQAKMLEPEVLRDGRRIKELQQELANNEQQLLQLYEHYEEACELN